MSQLEKYGVILMDPPWSYDDFGCEGGIGKHYRGTSVERLAEMPIAELAADTCALFVWTTGPFFPDAVDLVRTWGFEYVSVAFVWAKVSKDGIPRCGLGRMTRSSCEFIVYARRGKPKRAIANVQQMIICPPGKHSKKPLQAHKRIEQLFPQARRLGLFARMPQFGWECWGNECRHQCDIRTEKVLERWERA